MCWRLWKSCILKEKSIYIKDVYQNLVKEKATDIFYLCAKWLIHRICGRACFLLCKNITTSFLDDLIFSFLKLFSCKFISPHLRTDGKEFSVNPYSCEMQRAYRTVADTLLDCVAVFVSFFSLEVQHRQNELGPRYRNYKLLGIDRPQILLYKYCAVGWNHLLTSELSGATVYLPFLFFFFLTGLIFLHTKTCLHLFDKIKRHCSGCEHTWRHNIHSEALPVLLILIISICKI